MQRIWTNKSLNIMEFQAILIGDELAFEFVCPHCSHLSATDYDPNIKDEIPCRECGQIIPVNYEGI